MQQKKITFRAPTKKDQTLDSLARVRQCNRSFVLNEAIDQYLSLNEYHTAIIREGIRQDKAGETVSHEEVRALVASLTSSHDR
jgi:RHH-type rel operon transcriptional repressor/antitoxin RelB